MPPRKHSLQTMDTILLGLLSRQRMHGYDLYKELARLEGVGMVWRIKQSMIYAILDRLEREGLVEGQRVQAETRPDRKEYQLTPAGKAVFLKWVSNPVQHGREMRQDFMARLYFARFVSQKTVMNLLTEQHSACKQWLEDFDAAYSKLNDDQIFEKLVMQFRIQQTEAMLKWLDSCSNQQLPEGK
jgi:PadR family transcriptional regulator, regulatory protein AphA